jgi:hypothetical protein
MLIENKQKITMRNGCIAILAVFSLLAGQKTYSQAGTYSHSIFNWGIRGGVNALSTNFYEVSNGESEITLKPYKNKVGYNISAFTRINLGRLLMQHEVAWNSYSQDLSFASTDADNSYNHTDLSRKSNSFNINVLVGYNIIKEGPFLLNIGIGPSFKYIYKTDYDINNQNYTVENPQYVHYKYSGIVGFAIIISKFYFDIRYELNFPDTDIHLDEIPEIPESLKNVYIHKNENILSFSFGFIH